MVGKLIPAAALAAALVLSGIAVSRDGLSLVPNQALAVDCIDDASYAYASAGAQVNSANGVQANLDYFNPDVCFLSPPHHGQFSAESISIYPGPGWVQVGIIKRFGWSESKMYCEFRPTTDPNPPRVLREYDISNQQHAYELSVSHSEGQSYWDCLLDDVPKMSFATSYLGFSSGSWIPIQGETDSLYSQIGKDAPNKFVFSNIKRLKTQWALVDVCCLNNVSGYGGRYDRDVPSGTTGKFRNWTN